VRREDVGERHLTARRRQRGREIERVQRLGGAQVPGRNPRDIAADLHQRAGQRRRLAGQQCPRPVRRELAVPGQQPDQQEADRVDDYPDEQHDQDDRQRVLVLAAAAATAATAAEQLGVEREPDQQRGHDAQEGRDRHDRHVLMRHMRHLVREHALELVRLQLVE
jgi:hypothetical protein